MAAPAPVRTDHLGVRFPEHDGTRSTSRAGREVLAQAIAELDPQLSDELRGAADWRRSYARFLHRFTAAELAGTRDPAAVPRAGLDALHTSFTYGRDDLRVPVADAAALPAAHHLDTLTVEGEAAAASLTIPYRGRELAGEELRTQLDRWVAEQRMEPGAAAAVAEVAANPGWWSLPGRTVVVLGAGSEMGPTAPLLRWGATVALVDLPGDARWTRLLELVRRSGGRALVPVASDQAAPGADPATTAGVDLTRSVPELAGWVSGLPGPLAVGSYAYVDGARHVEVNLAADAVQAHVAAHRDDVTLAGLLTPTDVYPVPLEVVEAARARVGGTGPVRASARALSRGRAYVPHHPTTFPTADGAEAGIADALVLQQGPNYALAKRLQRWRFRLAAAEGTPVSVHVAPATRTRSVTSNRLLAAAYAGASRFDVEVFEPATSTALMAALLVHDLQAPPGTPPSPAPGDDAAWWSRFAATATHGGLWRHPFLPRSVLPLAAVVGLPVSLHARGR